VTTVLGAANDVVVIAKHSYPPGVYRVPGGGLNPGEPLEIGAAREALEETGLPFTPDHYVLRVSARFTCGQEHVDWTTHIVSGAEPRTLPAPIDVREIREARWVTWADLVGSIADLMLATGRPLFAYRVDLHRATYTELVERGLLQSTC
jgi:8-oxo-dGTP pyrophosphatase MutT (NUDIX family)